MHSWCARTEEKYNYIDRKVQSQCMTNIVWREKRWMFGRSARGGRNRGKQSTKFPPSRKRSLLFSYWPFLSLRVTVNIKWPIRKLDFEHVRLGKADDPTQGTRNADRYLCFPLPWITRISLHSPMRCSSVHFDISKQWTYTARQKRRIECAIKYNETKRASLFLLQCIRDQCSGDRQQNWTSDGKPTPNKENNK